MGIEIRPGQIVIDLGDKGYSLAKIRDEIIRLGIMFDLALLPQEDLHDQEGKKRPGRPKKTEPEKVEPVSEDVPGVAEGATDVNSPSPVVFTREIVRQKLTALKDQKGVEQVASLLKELNCGRVGEIPEEKFGMALELCKKRLV